jgi:hypothetical protein
VKAEYTVDIRIYRLDPDGSCDEIGSGGEPPEGWENVATFKTEKWACLFADRLHEAERRMRRRAGGATPTSTEEAEDTPPSSASDEYRRGERGGCEPRVDL